MTEHAPSATVAFRFSGRLDPASFTAFAEHRAAMLSLRLAIDGCDQTRCCLQVSGPAPLIDAFEMATSLGPYDCIILDVTRMSTTPSNPAEKKRP